MAQHLRLPITNSSRNLPNAIRCSDWSLSFRGLPDDGRRPYEAGESSFSSYPSWSCSQPRLAQPYFFESEWSAAATCADFGISYCPSNTAVTELGSLSAFASISEICHI